MTSDKRNIGKAITDFLDELTSVSESNIKQMLISKDLDVPMKPTLGDILLVNSKITPEQLNEALETQRNQKEKKERLGEILLKKDFVSEENLYKALASQFSLKYIETIDVEKINLDLIRKVPINFCKRFKIIPLAKDDTGIYVAAEDPTNVSVFDDLRMLLDSNIKILISNPTEIIDAVNKAYDKATTAQEFMDGMEEGIDGIDFDEPKDLLDTDDEAPIIRLVNSLLTTAVKEGASDIHIEPFEKDMAVRFRIDGDLRDVLKPPKRYQSSIATRIKIMAKLNIAEKRLPQDGKIPIKIAGKDVDIRVSTLPTQFGERIVMRLLDRSSTQISLKDIGLSDKMNKKIMEIISKPHGIFLVTGPTGSGKTTTLYACMKAIYSVEKNIITVEDPPEYQLSGIGQIQVNPKINMTFANGLRSILRQDPDVIMVGEIRDSETADVAVQASLTGHLVFSTVHTNDSFGAITRLVDMKIEPFLVASTVEGILAQRLVRKLCPHCKKAIKPTDAELSVLNIKRETLVNGVIYKAVGCSECQAGYKGRGGIFELLPIDDEMRSLIIKQPDSVSIKRNAIDRGMQTLRDDGALKVAQGSTTIEEIIQATQVDTLID